MLQYFHVLTNKTQVFKEISMIENWLIIHDPSLCYTCGKYTFHNLEDSSCVQLARVKNPKIFFENSNHYFTHCTCSKINQCQILHIPIVLNLSNAMPEFLDFNSVIITCNKVKLK